MTQRLTRALKSALVLSASALIFAGGSATAQVRDTEMERIKNARLDEVYIKPGVDFSKYTKIQIAPVGIWYQSDFAPDQKGVQRMQTWFYAAISSALADGYEIVGEPGPDVLRVQAQVIDLKINTTNPDPSIFERYEFDVREGQLTLVGELRDSMTGEVLVRGADLEKRANDKDQQSAEANWEDVQLTFRRWAAVLRAWLDEVHGADAD